MADLNSEQRLALEILEKGGNVFLTGAAGSGKSFLLRHFLKARERKTFPILASTGAAAILVGGRTFHSYFGLGILEGGVDASVDRACANKRVVKRIQKTIGLVIDEVSMLSGRVLRAAEEIARRSRGCDEPWGGLRVIAVGDFAQLPPVNPYGTEKEWAFMDPVWQASQFTSIFLSRMMRTTDSRFLEVLNWVREGVVNERVQEFFQERTMQPPADFDGTRLFSRRDRAETYNLQRLDMIDSDAVSFPTRYSGKELEVEKFKRNSPIPDEIVLKVGALIMLRQNNPEGKWVNGSLGHITAITETQLSIELLSGRLVHVEVADFTLLDAEGIPVVTAKNFPVQLAWAVTIHKAQGATLDKLSVDLRNMWEPGQAYVAISRVRDPENLFVEGWGVSSFKTDQAVIRFHQELGFWSRGEGGLEIVPAEEEFPDRFEMTNFF